MINIVISSRYKIERNRLKKIVADMLAQKGFGPQYNLNIIFIGKNKMRKIADQYKKENLALPVLTFSYLDEKNNPENLLGEIFICYPQAVLLAAERDKRVDEMIINLIDHGIKNLLK
ncbi:MAG: rRNA maturation RNase YbeY [Microgenomates group bacterium]|jgi:rRNA maturation RNase YbeY|nr:rRNA maturation RNase YbeY [Microgenomates group bacterium]